MIAFKCKMCGGDMELLEGATVAECPYCLTKQTLPKLDNDKRANLYDRANHFRRQNEYDKAMSIYEQILQEDRTDAEAYWSLVLCRYGIEYVEDPTSHKRVPTVNRVQYTSILADEDFKSALEYADSEQRVVYEAEAKAIDEIQKGILAISKQEEPFDVFICYKETDANGRRTPDSVLATDLYHQLTKEGFKVFFSRITLEDKIGTAYEPYIFAALNSAKVMVVLGTKPEYFNAVWVKNEWSRYLALIRAGADKTLVPAYRDMDPYDLPDEFSHLQAQDMSKLGFMQDLIRGIKKITGKEEKTSVPIRSAVTNTNADPLLRRAFMFLEDGDWNSANEYAEKVLDLEPENAKAYLVKMMIERKAHKEDELVKLGDPLTDTVNYQKILRFADPELKDEVTGWNQNILEWNDRYQKVQIRDKAVSKIRNATTVAECKEGWASLKQIEGFDGVDEAFQLCEDKIEEINNRLYNQADQLQKEGKWDDAISVYTKVIGYKDSEDHIAYCKEQILEEAYNKAKKLQSEKKYDKAIKAFTEIKAFRDSEASIQECYASIEAEKEAAEAEKKAIEEEKRRQQELAEKEAKEAAAREKKRILFIILIGIVIIAAVIVVTQVIIPNSNYQKAVSLREAGKYSDAREIFANLRDYSDAASQIKETTYQQAKALMTDGDYSGAYRLLLTLKEYKDVGELLKNDDNLTAAARDAKLALYKEVGGIVTFGTFPQTKEGTDQTPIEWIVLDYDEVSHKALLLSRYGLAAVPYNTEYDITWEKCTLRAWLNGEFLNKAFSATEQSAILMTKVDNSKSQGYSEWNTDGGNNTEDQIFLLSYAEANKYLGVIYNDSNNLKSRVAPTAYALARGAWTSDSNNTEDGAAAGWWWLRSPGYNSDRAANVFTDGSLLDRQVYLNYGVVRPAFWLNLESDIF